MGEVTSSSWPGDHHEEDDAREMTLQTMYQHLLTKV